MKRYATVKKNKRKKERKEEEGGYSKWAGEPTGQGGKYHCAPKMCCILY